MKYNDKKFKVIGAVHTPIFYIKFSKQSLILFVLLGAILFIGIGYSAINSVTAEITGGITATTQNGVFITDVTYVSGVDANVDASNIEYYRGTMLQSLISLSEQNPNSEIKYKVTIYNNSEETYPFVAVLYDEEFYDNPDIVFEISGFNIGETIGAKETKELYITFKYKNQTIPEKTILSSYINFKIAEPNRLMATASSEATETYLRGTITKEKIEEIEFAQGTQPPEGTINELSFDASEKQDKSIMGYYTDTDGNGLYKLTFLSPEIIATNKNAGYLFQNLSSVKNIKFDNFSTYGANKMNFMFGGCKEIIEINLSKFDTSYVTDIQGMFYNCASIKTLDVSKFNTSKVKEFCANNGWANNGTFQDCTSLENIDISSWDTSKATSFCKMFSGCSSLVNLNVKNINTSNAVNMASMFKGCSGLTTLDVSGFDTRSVTAMFGMFYGCSSLTTLDVSNFNTSQVKLFCNNNAFSDDGIFQNCASLESLDLSNWDTSASVSFTKMFSGCTNLTNLDISNFNTSNVMYMSYMFRDCNKLTSLDLSHFDTTKTNSFDFMFQGCKNLECLNISNFKLKNNIRDLFANCYSLNELNLSGVTATNITNMQDTFWNCRSLKSLDLNDWDVQNLTTTHQTFSNCTALETLNISNWKTSDKLTRMHGMFYSCSSLKQLDLSNLDTTGVENADFMFYKCESLTELDISNFNTSNMKSMWLMFWLCSGLTKIYVSEFNAETNTGWTTTAVTKSEGMFRGCTKLVGGNGTTYNNNITDKTYAVIDTATTPGYLTNINKNKKINRLISASRVAPTGKYLNSTIIKNKIETIEFKLGKEKPEGTIETFDASEKQDESIMAYYTDTDRNGLYELTFTSDGVIATNTETQYLFQSLTQLTKITFDNFSTYGATNMQSMFSNCSKLITLDVSKFNTSNVTSMLEMFYNCKALTTLNLSNFNTSSVTNMQTMFSGCMALTTLDLSGFNTINVITMRTMFNNCKALTTIYVSEFNAETSTGWTTTAVTNSTSMFSNCTNIIGGNGTTYNNNITDKTYAVIDTAETPGYLTNINHRWRKN